jgi:hypothetical protein
MYKPKMSYAAKVITAGVMLKAVVMGTLVSLLAVTAFTQSIILVLVSATATGIFGLLIVLVQTHSEARLHQRINDLETQVDTKASEITEKQDEAAQIAADKVTEKVAEIVAPSKG